jgi:CRP-like cAMP-binding protein
MKDNLLEYLNHNSSLTHDEKRNLLELFQVKLVRKDDFWIRQNDSCTDIAFLTKGILRVFHEKEGEQITMEFVFPNSFTTAFGCSSENNKSRWNYQAISDCELLLIDKESHREFVVKNSLSFDFYEKHLTHAYSNKEMKLLSMLHIKAEERCEKLFKEQPQIFNLVPLKHIASSLGIKPETLSRLRNKHAKRIS